MTQTDQAHIQILSQHTDTLVPNLLTGTESISQPYEFKLQVTTPLGDIQSSDYIGQTISLQLYGANNTYRYLHGLIDEVTHCTDMTTHDDKYIFTLRPHLYKLQSLYDCQMYSDMSAPDIITQLLNRFETSHFDFSRLRNSYPPLTKQMQYNESGLTFLHRLLDNAEITYYFLHTDTHSNLIFVDQNDAFEHSSQPLTLKFNHDMHDDIVTLQTIKNTSPSKIHALDYNYQQPNKSVTATQSLTLNTPLSLAKPLTYCIHPSRDLTLNDAVSSCQKEQQAMIMRQSHVHFTTTCAAIFPGCIVQLPSIEGPSLIQSLSHRFSCLTQSTQKQATSIVSPINHAQAVSLLAFTTQRPTTTPVSFHHLGAVNNTQEQTLLIGDYGEININYQWQTEAQTPSMSVRTSAVSAGNSYGQCMPPRHQQEVLIDFINDDTSNPIALQMTYNASHPPYLSQENTLNQTSFKSTNSSNTARYNELTFYDQPGNTGFTLSTCHQLIYQCDKNHTADIKGNYDATITQGNIQQVSRKNSLINAKQSIALLVHENTINIDTNGITLTAAKVNITTST